MGGGRLPPTTGHQPIVERRPSRLLSMLGRRPSTNVRPMSGGRQSTNVRPMSGGRQSVAAWGPIGVPGLPKSHRGASDPRVKDEGREMFRKATMATAMDDPMPKAPAPLPKAPAPLPLRTVMKKDEFLDIVGKDNFFERAIESRKVPYLKALKDAQGELEKLRNRLTAVNEPSLTTIETILTKSENLGTGEELDSAIHPHIKRLKEALKLSTNQGDVTAPLNKKIVKVQSALNNLSSSNTLVKDLTAIESRKVQYLKALKDAQGELEKLRKLRTSLTTIETNLTKSEHLGTGKELDSAIQPHIKRLKETLKFSTNQGDVTAPLNEKIVKVQSALNNLSSSNALVKDLTGGYAGVYLLYTTQDKIRAVQGLSLTEGKFEESVVIRYSLTDGEARGAAKVLVELAVNISLYNGKYHYGGKVKTIALTPFVKDYNMKTFGMTTAPGADSSSTVFTDSQMILDPSKSDKWYREDTKDDGGKNIFGNTVRDKNEGVWLLKRREGEHALPGYVIGLSARIFNEAAK